MLKKIKETAKKTVDPQCFVLFVLSHGKIINNEEVVFGVDGKPLTKNRIIRALSSKSCPNLCGVPLLLFFQCCRGGTDEVITVCIKSFLAGYTE